MRIVALTRRMGIPLRQLQKAASDIPALRQTSPIGVPSSAYNKIKATNASANVDIFTPKTPSAAPASELEFCGFKRSSSMEARQRRLSLTSFAADRSRRESDLRLANTIETVHL
jgi:hypothetical protein